MDKLTDTHYLLLNRIIKDCTENGISLVLSHNKTVRLLEDPPETASAGGFYSDDRILMVGTGGRPLNEWFTYLLHEYCHLLQFLDGIYTPRSIELEKRFWLWLDKEEDFNETQLDEIFNDIIRIEKDAEVRTYSILLNNRDIMDPEEYIEHANVYLYGYSLVREKRKWFSKSPREFSELQQAVPNTFQFDYFNLPDSLRQLYLNTCFKED